MKRILKIEYKIIAILSIFIFLFPNIILADGEKNEKIVGDNTYYYLLDEDDGTSGKNVKEIEWRFKGFKKDYLDSGLSINDFTKNETYGWYTYKKDDIDWVVLRRMYTSIS